MLELLIVLSVVEAVGALAVLAIYLLLVLKRLRNSAAYFAKISFGVRAIETQVGHIGPAVTKINATLEEINAALPGLAQKAEQATAGPQRRR